MVGTHERRPIVTDRFKQRLLNKEWNKAGCDISLSRRAIILNEMEPLYDKNGNRHHITGRHLGNLLRMGGYRYIVPKNRPLEE